MRWVAGWTLVENLVAIIVLSIAATSLAASIGHALRMRQQAISLALATASAEGWLESWRSGPWLATSAGSSSETEGAREIVIEWSIDAGVCLAEATVRARVRSVAPASAVLTTRRFRERAETC